MIQWTRVILTQGRLVSTSTRYWLATAHRSSFWILSRYMYSVTWSHHNTIDSQHQLLYVYTVTTINTLNCRGGREGDMRVYWLTSIKLLSPISISFYPRNTESDTWALTWHIAAKGTISASQGFLIPTAPPETLGYRRWLVDCDMNLHQVVYRFKICPFCVIQINTLYLEQKWGIFCLNLYKSHLKVYFDT